MRFDPSRPMVLATAMIAAVLFHGSFIGTAGAADFDGITVIDLEGVRDSETFPSGEALVVFVSGKGSYAAVVTRRGTHGGCQSLAVPNSYTGDTIAFGLDAPIAVRKIRLDTYCPPFRLKLLDADTVRIDAGYDVTLTQKVIAKVPFAPLDFNTQPFTTHDIKGVRLGPLLDNDGVKPLSAAGYASDRSRGFQKSVTTSTGQRAMLGEAAASEITGWQWHVLYFAQFSEEFEQKATQEVMDEIVDERYGPPSSRMEGSGYRLWVYDVDGHQLDLNTDTEGACARTIESSLKRDPLHRVLGYNREHNSFDLGPWGCGLTMEMNAASGDGGVSGYFVKMESGYVKAINHFYQRIDQTKDLLAKVEAQVARKPKL